MASKGFQAKIITYIAHARVPLTSAFNLRNCACPGPIVLSAFYVKESKYYGEKHLLPFLSMLPNDPHSHSINSFIIFILYDSYIKSFTLLQVPHCTLFIIYVVLSSYGTATKRSITQRLRHQT